MSNNLQDDMISYNNKQKKDGQDYLNNLNPLKNSFIYGPSSIKQQNYGPHPLERMERTHNDRQEYRDMSILRSVQGIQAPLKLMAERRAASQIGRLPFLPSSNIQLDVLTGRDEMILPENVFDSPQEFCEVQLPPHMTMERKFNLL